mmetsp:Transcript_26632/g.85732  ORF Transcript_26632/g.85732 Transcript_26632/m.85732 type:complete len:234 (+) Transcript_26632:85-786(+)
MRTGATRGAWLLGWWWWLRSSLWPCWSIWSTCRPEVASIRSLLHRRKTRPRTSLSSVWSICRRACWSCVARTRVSRQIVHIGPRPCERVRSAWPGWQRLKRNWRGRGRWRFETSPRPVTRTRSCRRSRYTYMTCPTSSPPPCLRTTSTAGPSLATRGRPSTRPRCTSTGSCSRARCAPPTPTMPTYSSCRPTWAVSCTRSRPTSPWGTPSCVARCATSRRPRPTSRATTDATT